jgi:1,4-dihydroxy-2-naphthoate octaprenyltransferase
MVRWKAFAGVARLPFLLLPVTLVTAGAAASARDGAFAWSRTLAALVGLVALHAAVNIFNEVSDLRTGIDLRTRRTPFSGGSGILPGGRLGPRAALGLGIACSLVGLAVGIGFVWVIGARAVPLFAAGAFLVVGYTDFLARAGLGEIAAGLGLGTLPVLGTAFVQDGSVGAAAVAASLPAFFMTFNLLLLNEFPDQEADRAGGRRNLVLLFGRRVAARIYAGAFLCAPSCIVVAVAIDALPWPALAAALPSIFFAAPVRWALRRPAEPVPVPALGANVAWNLATNTLVAAGLVGAIALRI